MTTIRSISLKLFLLSIIAFSQNTAQVTIKEKIGQMLMVGFTENNGFKDTLITDIAYRNLGGVILFGYNLQNPVQIQQLTAELKSYENTPLFISADQEGGRVARLKAQNGFSDTYSAFKLGTVFDKEDSTRSTAAMMAGWLKDTGINVNLAPVVDVNVNPLSPAIGKLERSYSQLPLKVFEHASYFIDEFHQKNIITALKHYPGHGSALNDSHLGFTDITQTWSDSELIPFKELINSGFEDIIMSGHLFNAQWDTLYPSSLSDFAIKTILRDSLSFSGVVISDELFMQAISNNYGFDEAVVKAVNAGTDILLFRQNEYNGFSLVNHVIGLIESKVDSGIISAARIDEAYTRIINLKNKWLISSAGNNLIAENSPPSEFKLSNYPNPFNGDTKIFVQADAPCDLKLSLFNVLGEEVAKIAETKINAGRHIYNFNSFGLSSGIYLVLADIGTAKVTHKVVLMK